jgi:hypothetical protein
MLDLPIVGITREAWTRINVEQLASTRATSAVEIAAAVSDSPGHPYPCNLKMQTSLTCVFRWGQSFESRGTVC